MSIERLLPVELGQGRIRYAQGIKAGRWVFVTGCMAQNFTDGIAPDVIAGSMPHGGLPKREKEAGLVFDHIARVLSEAGTDLSNLVRTDQYYTSVEAVPPYQAVRRQKLGQLIPPSTSIAMQGFVLPDEPTETAVLRVLETETGWKLGEAESDSVMAGYIYDSRQTDHAWVEIEAFLFCFDKSETPSSFPSGGEFEELVWCPLDADSVNQLPSQEAILARAAVKQLATSGRMDESRASDLLAATGKDA